MKKSMLLFLILLFLTACAGNTIEPELPPAGEVAPSAVAESDPAGRPTPTNEPAEVAGAEEATTLPPTLTTVPTTAPSDATPTAVSPAEDSATATAAPEEPAPPAETAMDGQNPDGTFYRGLATAPITMMDYSDFL